MTTLSKDEVVKMAREAGAVFDPQWGIASNVGTATFERFATLCRADLVAENAALKQAHEINADTLNAMQVEIDDWKARALKAEQSTIPPWRGYALLGTGNYVINHTADFDPELGAELIITIATDDDRSGNRQVGESRDNDPNKLPIQAADMAIRIGFLNERGLFALEDQLRMLRSVHFPDATPPQPAAQESTSAVPVVEQLVEALDGLFSGDVVVWSLGGSARPRAAIEAGKKFIKENGK